MLADTLACYFMDSLVCMRKYRSLTRKKKQALLKTPDHKALKNTQKGLGF